MQIDTGDYGPASKRLEIQRPEAPLPGPFNHWDIGEGWYADPELPGRYRQWLPVSTGRWLSTDYRDAQVTDVDGFAWGDVSLREPPYYGSKTHAEMAVQAIRRSRSLAGGSLLAAFILFFGIEVYTSSRTVVLVVAGVMVLVSLYLVASERRVGRLAKVPGQQPAQCYWVSYAE